MHGHQQPLTETFVAKYSLTVLMHGHQQPLTETFVAKYSLTV